jgi:hypothetical protein
MKQIYCPDIAIVENKDVIVCQQCTIFTNDESIVTLIKPKEFPKIGESLVKDEYYFKEGELVKATKSEIVTKDVMTVKIATEIKDAKVIDEKLIKEKIN